MIVKRTTLIAFITGTALIWACSITPTTPPPSPPTPPIPEEPESQIMEITAEQLYMAYKANQANADVQFKGETLKVTGVVQSMDKDAAGTAYIMLSSGGTNKKPAVKCMFSKGYGGEMVGVTTGDTVIIQGIAFGYAEYPIITECKLIEKK